MNACTNLIRAFAVAAIALNVPCLAFCQGKINGPTALIISYRANRGERAQFRSFMEHDGVAQFDQWKRDDVCASYKLLFTTYASETFPDMFLMLKFDHFTDLEHWQKIEQKYPGGLPIKAQTMAVVETEATADIIEEKQSATPTPDSQFVVLEYDVLADAPKYIDYVHGYVVPQFDSWMRAGVLKSYGVYTNQNPAGAPWSSFILLEYTDLHALAARESVKNKSRADLAAADPVWKKWSNDKSVIRKEKAAIPALLLK